MTPQENIPILCPCYDCFRVYRIFNDVFLCPIYVNYILTNATSLLNDPAEIKALVQDGPDIVHMIQVL